MSTAQRSTARRNGSRSDTLEHQVNCLTWLLAEQTLRTIRLAQVVASMMLKQAEPQIMDGIANQLLDVTNPIQGAPPVLPSMPPGA